jgi:hypothetical protein
VQANGTSAPGARPPDAFLRQQSADAARPGVRVDGEQADDGPLARPADVSVAAAVGIVRDGADDTRPLLGEDERRVRLAASHVANVLAVREQIARRVGRDILLVRGHHHGGDCIELVGAGVPEKDRRHLTEAVSTNPMGTSDIGFRNIVRIGSGIRVQYHLRDPAVVSAAAG